MSISKFIFLAISLMVFSASPTFAHRIILEGRSEFTPIDNQDSLNAINALKSENPQIRNNAIDAVKKNPSHYNPIVFYQLSRNLFERGNKDEAIFWFYAGQLRAIYDGKRCADETAGSAVGVLNQEYGQEINEYAFANIELLEATIKKVIEFDKNTKHFYDQRWINLHGMNIMIEDLSGQKAVPKAQSRPSEEWPKIADETRTNYYNSFKKAMEQIKSTKK